MAKTFIPDTSKTQIDKSVQSEHIGVRLHNLSRHTIGFVVQGCKLIHEGDEVHRVESGDLFYLPAGLHYIEDIPEEGRNFEQIVFYFTAEQFGAILSCLSVELGYSASRHHDCAGCKERNYVVCPASKPVRSCFQCLNQYMKDGFLADNPTAEAIKMVELVYLLVSDDDCCLQCKILEHSDMAKEAFEQVIRDNIFSNVSIEDLAVLTNRSLTSFKKEFRRRFFEPPHRWLIRQRLMHARLLLISSGKPVAEVGNECRFPNTSHFIKLFRKEFGMTPAVYRSVYAEKRGVTILKSGGTQTVAESV